MRNGMHKIENGLKILKLVAMELSLLSLIAERKIKKTETENSVFTKTKNQIKDIALSHNKML